MTVKEFKEKLNQFDECLEIIFASNYSSAEYDAECGNFHVHADLNDKQVQLVFTIDGDY